MKINTKILFKNTVAILIIGGVILSNFTGLVVYAQDATDSATSSKQEENSSLVPNDLESLEELSKSKQLDLKTNPQGSAQVKRAVSVRSLKKKTFRADESFDVVVENTFLKDIKVKVFDISGAQAPVEVEELSDEEPVVLKISPKSNFKPGRFRLNVEDKSGKTLSTQDFNWGVLAINTNKSIYTPNETVKLSMAVLDQEGEMVCDAKVFLDIKNPSGETVSLSTDNGKIKVNPECHNKDVTLIPDYETAYNSSSEGIYNMTLTGQTGNGNFTVTDNFEVRKEVPFIVERETATRIYPVKNYPVSLNITANQDFEGVVTEIVPESFSVSAQSGVKSFDSVATQSAKLAVKNDLEAGIFDLDLPSVEKYPLSQKFGGQHKNDALGKKYTEFGVVGHDGVDFDMPPNTPVLATADGEVVRARENSDYGTTIVIQHSWGKSYYGHLSKITSKEGQKVKKGDPIGLSGSTGLSSGPHLHFGIKPNNNDTSNGYFGKIDPLPFLGLNKNGEDIPKGLKPQIDETGVKVLTWNLKLKKGENIKLGYSYNAPDISPQFYKLGPLEFHKKEKDGESVVFREARQWQIASDSVVVSTGIVDTEAQFGGQQRKVAYVNSNWYVFYTDATDVRYKKSSDGSSWGTLVDVDSSDADNLNPTVYVSGSLIYVSWIDDSTDSIETNTINTASADALGTKCTSADQGTFDSTNIVSNAVGSDGTVYLAATDSANDTEEVMFSLVFSGCTFTDITTGSGVSNANGTKPVLVATGNTVTAIYQDGNLSMSIHHKAAGNFWAIQDGTIAAITDSIISATTDGTTIWVLTNSSTTATNLYSFAPPAINDIDTDISATGTSGNISCPAANDCKMVYTDGTDGDLTFVDCNDEDCDSPTLTDLNTDIGTTGMGSPDIFCISATDCKVVFTDLTGVTELVMVDCSNATCSTQDSGSPVALDTSLLSSVAVRPSIYCVATDDCKVVYNDTGVSNPNELKFIDCSNSTCSTQDAGSPVTLDPTTGQDKSFPPDVYCPTSTNCKVVYPDSTTGVEDLLFIDCSNSTCSTQDAGSPVTLDSGVGTTSAGSQITCPAADNCKVAYADSSDQDLIFIDCNSENCSSASTPVVLDATAGNGGASAPPYISCPTSANCKVSSGDGTDADTSFVDCNDEDCDAPVISDIDTGVARGGAIYCITSSDCKVFYKNEDLDDTFFVDCNSETCGAVSTLTAPFTGATNLLSVSIAYDSTNDVLYANAIKDASEQAYYKYTDATNISWSSETSYGFTAGDLSQISSNLSGAEKIGVALRQGANLEFNQVTFTPTTDQLHYRWRSDDGVETNGTSLVSEDTLYSGLAKNTNIRLRAMVSNSTNGQAASYQLRLESATKSGGSCGDDETYAQVPDTPTTQHFDMTTTTHYADQDASTNTTTGAGVLSDPSGYSFTAGKLVESTSNSTNAISIGGKKFTEVEYVFQANSNATGSGSYCFRVTNAGAALSSMTADPELSLEADPAAGPTNDQLMRHGNWFSGGVEQAFTF